LAVNGKTTKLIPGSRGHLTALRKSGVGDKMAATHKETVQIVFSQFMVVPGKIKIHQLNVKHLGSIFSASQINSAIALI
jgi:hypothetical protein